MRIVFSGHAHKQLVERNISPTVVRKTVERPTKIIEQYPRRYRAVRAFQKKKKPHLLVVIYDATETTYDIVTAFITSKIEKYL